MSRPGVWPKQWIGTWIASDEKAVSIERRGEVFLVTVRPGRDSEPYESAELLGGSRKNIERLPGCACRDEHDRLYLEIEAGTPGVGPTYRLYAAVDGEEEKLAPAPNTVPVSELVLVPASFIGLYDDYDDDLGVPFGEPYLPLRLST